MKLFSTSILLVLSQALFGQLQDNITQHLSKRNITDIKRFADTISKKENHIGTFWEIEREIAYGFQEGVLIMKKSIVDNDNPHISTVYTFHINLISYGEEIIFYDLREKRPKKINDEWVEYFPSITKYQNDSLFKLLEAFFYQLYGGSLNKNELFVDSIVYGTNCSKAGNDPIEKILIDHLVKTKNKEQLFEWIKSSNTEKQLYAVSGLFKLVQKGLKLTDEEINYITNVLNKKGFVRTCSGCIYSKKEIKLVSKDFKF